MSKDTEKSGDERAQRAYEQKARMVDRLHKNLAKKQSSAAALMNNTKWREVFSVLAAQGVCCSLALLTDREQEPEDPTWPNTNRDQQDSIRSECIQKDMYGDCSLWGPFKYEWILWMRVSHYRHNTGRPHHQQDLQQLVEALEALGQLPIERTDEFVQINGYRVFD